MKRTVFCKKLCKKSEGLDYPPYLGELGERIYNHISKSAWEDWMNRQTMLINEYRLNLMDEKSRQFLKAEMKKFLFDSEKV